MPNPVPDGYHTVTPYLICRNAARAISFYEKAFGAKLLYRLPGPNGTIGHAELEVGDSRVMLADESPDGAWRSPQTVGGTPVTMVLYVTDVDAVFQRALAAGGTEVRPVKDQFYGDRVGTLQDPFGHIWSIGTHIEDVPADEMSRRAASLAGGP
jgi:PhnB protein